MGKYLDKFRSSLNQNQSSQIFKLLNKQRSSGQIRTVEEFSRKLDSLIRELTTTTMTPTLKPIVAKEGEQSSSERFNFMLERAQDDLETAFTEANNIAEVQVSHEALVRDVILKNLRAGVAELEGKISLYEFLNKDPHGFDSNLFSTFRESKEGRTQRGKADTQSLFTDPRTGLLVPPSQDASVELIGERLVLPLLDKTFHTIKDVRLVFDSLSPQSDKIVNPPNMLLSNIIDGQKGTYWSQSWLFANQQPFVEIQLELDLGVTRDINFLEIEPITKNGFLFKKLTYLDGSNTFVDLALPEQNLISNVGLQFTKISTRKIVLTFRNENGHYTHFQFSDQRTLLEQSQIARTTPITPDMSGLSTYLAPLIQSGKVRNIVNTTPPSTSDWAGYEFQFGFDNIKVGVASYNEMGIYSSVALPSSSTAVLGIKTVERRPYQDIGGNVQFTTTTYDSVPAGQFLGSIEYWITKQDFHLDGTLARTTTFPILPVGTTRVIEERLVLSSKSDISNADNDIGSLMFYTTKNDGNIIIYRNGVVFNNEDSIYPLTPSSGWQSIVTPAEQTPGSGQAMKYGIRIFGAQLGDIFTVSYTPAVSTTQIVPKPDIGGYPLFTDRGLLQVVDLVGDLSARRTETQAVVTDAVGGSESATTSKLYCVIILRQNTADISLSPAVEEYNLFAGKRDTTKFSEV